MYDLLELFVSITSQRIINQNAATVIENMTISQYDPMVNRFVYWLPKFQSYKYNILVTLIINYGFYQWNIILSDTETYENIPGE